MTRSPQAESAGAKSTGSGSRYGRTVSLALVAVIGISVLGSSGCCFLGRSSGELFSTVIERPLACYRERVWARRAFNLCYPKCQAAHPSDFRAGFIEGYCDACNGGGQTPPMLPPRSYWQSRYKSDQGEQKVRSWFDGYPMGVKAARADGAANNNQLLISQQLAAALKHSPTYPVGNGEPGSALVSDEFQIPEPHTIDYIDASADGQPAAGSAATGTPLPQGSPLPAALPAASQSTRSSRMVAPSAPQVVPAQPSAWPPIRKPNSPRNR